MLFAFATIHQLYSQEIRIKGNVKDSLQNVIAGAQVILYAGDKKGILKFTSTNENGFFEIISLTNSEGYTLAVRMVGYKPFEQFIEPNEQEKYFQIILKDDNTIQEITITTKIPVIQQKGDTTIYQADHFRSGNERNLEDVLKKLPGITVNEEGDVFFKGKQIQKLLIEGDNVFDKDYKIGTKNISADMVKEIQGIDNYVDSPNLKGLASSKETVLNITLKDKKSRPFGETTLGAGIQEKWYLHNNTFQLQSKKKWVWLVQGNNIGTSPFSLSKSVSSLSEINLASLSKSEKNFFIPSFTGIPLRFNWLQNLEQRSNLNNLLFSNFTYFGKLHDKLTYRLIYQFYTDRNQLFRNSFTTFGLSENSFTLQENQQATLKPIQHAISLHLLHTPNEKARWENNFQVTFLQRKYENALTYNITTSPRSEPLQEISTETNRLIENELKYSYRVSENKAVLMNLHWANQKIEGNQLFNTRRFNDFFGLDSNTEAILQTNRLPGNTLQLQGKFIEKLLKRWQYGFSTENNFQQVEGFTKILYQLYNTQLELNSPEYLNNVSLQTAENAWKVSTSYSPTQYNTISTEWAWRHKWIGLADKKNQVSFLEPSLTLAWKFKKVITQTSYSFTWQNPALQQILNGYWIVGYRNFRRGAELIEFVPTHRFNVIWSLEDLTRLQNISLFGSYNRQSNYYGTASGIQQDFTLTENRIFPRNEMLNLSISIDKYVHSWLSGFKWQNAVTYQRYNNQVNNFELNENIFRSLFSKLQYRSLFNGFFNVEAYAQVMYSIISNDLLREDTQNWTITYRVSGFFQGWNKKFNGVLSAEKLDFRTQQVQQSLYFFDAELTWQLKKVQWGLEIYNLFDNDSLQQLTPSNISVQNSMQLLQGRWVMAKVKFRW
ncbi:MAG: carboxypeptidase-like regulatory domain-containing protein [Raineya sp.]|nr:carboxypeptidase-like regulatory domain-containing protein [Raineya sp.]